MESSDNGIEILGEEMCWERLRRTSVGRLGVSHDGQPAISPINYAVDGSSIVFRTRADSKISQAPLLERVAFEIDGYEPAKGAAWSVLIKGFGRFVDSDPEIAQADLLPLQPWVGAERSAWLRIVPVEVTGRRFRIMGDAITDGSIGWTDGVGNGEPSSDR